MNTTERLLLAVLSAAALVLAGCSRPAAEASAVPVAASVPASAPAPAASVSAAAAPPEPKFPDRVLWGDQHVHTSYSGDSALALNTLGPEQAVRFARGDEVKTSTGQMAKLIRGLDWVVISDHSDGLGTMAFLADGNEEMMKDPTLKRWYDMMKGGMASGQKAAREAISAQAAKKLPALVMNPKWGVSAWQNIVDVMEKYNEPGKFTAFIGYEWTSNGEVGQNLHRNVIFRDGADKTRDTPPLTTFESTVPGRKGTDPESLWKWLADWEAKTGGKALAIPHNADLSNGWMFRTARYGGEPMTPEWAQARARWEPLVEVFQNKGQGESHPTLFPNDEFAKFEIWDTSDLAGNAKKPGDIEFEYARRALTRGMALQDKLGTNPFKFGMVSGTDTHNSLSTGGQESDYWGKFPANEPKADRWNETYKQEKLYLRKDWTLGAAGVTGVWSTANTRAALWDAMMRKEVYASSGPRIALRFFAGYDFADADAQGDVAAAGYAKGVPMGGDLKPAAAGQTPTFLFAALKDPQGGNLDRVQIVKGWVDAKGGLHEKVFDVSWSGERRPNAKGVLPPVGNTVDVATASYTNSIGSGALAGVFKDPEFDPTLKAYYYARVIEIPTPRWTAYDALKFKVRMDPRVPMVIQERVVASPVWYAPEKP